MSSSKDLIISVRELIRTNGFNEIFIQLFEYICIIHGYVSSIILPLQQANESEFRIYFRNFIKIYGIFEATKTLIHRNMNNFSHIRMFSTIRSSFFLFHNNVQVDCP